MYIGPKMVSKWSQNNPKMVPKWSQNRPRTVPNPSQNGSQKYNFVFVALKFSIVEVLLWAYINGIWQNGKRGIRGERISYGLFFGT